MILTTISQTRPDYVALVLVLALAAFVTAAVFRKRKKMNEIREIQPVAPGSAGQLKIHNVEPRTAAMLMAIVAYRMGKPLNELRFISIKEVAETPAGGSTVSAEGGIHGDPL